MPRATEELSPQASQRERLNFLAKRAPRFQQQITREQRSAARVVAFRRNVFDRDGMTPGEWVALDYTMALLAGATPEETFEALQKLQNRSNNVRDYAVARTYDYITHTDILEADAADLILHTYTDARVYGVAHAEMLDLSERGVRGEPAEVYLERRRAGDDHEAACAAGIRASRAAGLL